MSESNNVDGKKNTIYRQEGSWEGEVPSIGQCFIKKSNL